MRDDAAHHQFDFWLGEWLVFDATTSKLVAFDRIESQLNGCAIVHSDSAEGIQRLNQEAAKAMAAGNRMGFKLRPEDAIRWLTINPAKAIGIDKQTGSLAMW